MIASQPQPAGESPLVIIVDDDDDVRTSLRELMLSVGLDVQSFASSRELLETDVPDRPGCLVLDVRMPGSSGLDLQQQLIAKGNPAWTRRHTVNLLAPAAGVVVLLIGFYFLNWIPPVPLAMKFGGIYYEVRKADDRFELAFNRPTFKEFVVRDRQGRVSELLAEATDAGVLAGLPLGKWYPELSDRFLVAVTEKRTKKEIELLADVLSKAGVQGSGFRVQGRAEACGA